MAKHLFIINPSAGKGHALEYIPEIHRLFKNSNDEYIIKITEYPGHATKLVKSYIYNEDIFVYSLGGDGTLNEIANAIVNTNSVLGTIPCGTGNDFIRSLISSKNYEDILSKTVNGEIRTIDTAKANDRYFINISSVGFDSEVVSNARLFKKKKFIPSSLSYIISLFYTPFKFKSIPMKIDIDGHIIEEDNLLLAICNGSQYGGGIPISPHSSIYDGKLDVCMVKNCKLTRLLSVLPKALNGNHTNVEEVNFFSGKSINIQSPVNFTLQSDGELFTCSEVSFTLHPKSLRILYPKI